MMIASYQQIKANPKKYSDWIFLAPIFSGSAGILIGLIIGSIFGLV